MKVSSGSDIRRGNWDLKGAAVASAVRAVGQLRKLVWMVQEASMADGF